MDFGSGNGVISDDWGAGFFTGEGTDPVVGGQDVLFEPLSEGDFKEIEAAGARREG
jgi:hypothetical protein